MPEHKVYVALGFHVNFYHSWRGDTPDEAGFGVDMRVVREIIKILDAASLKGKLARGYWDWDVYWTLQEIIPRYAPDIIRDVRRRVQAGLDEIVLGPYNNGANHAATRREFNTAVAYAFENPYGSGLRQIFGKVAPIYRPQESMLTAGQNAILLANGVRAVILPYSSIPFNTFSAFIPPLPLEQRYNPLWLRCTDGDTPITLLPNISIPDLLEHVCLETLMLDLHDQQASGKLSADVLIHINFDADGDNWLPLKLPKPLRWFPNSGGLEEYIRVVNRYPWSSFTVPSEYLEEHPPQGEVLVRQDMADGGFDGSYSWAEKYTSIQNWTLLERSRLATCRAMALSAKDFSPEQAAEIHRSLWQGVDSSFFQRLIGLSTTHFGMSTPVINEERQARAEAILGEAQQIASRAVEEAARALNRAHQGDASALYICEIYAAAQGDGVPGGEPVQAIVRLPIVLSSGIGRVKVEDAGGLEIKASWVNWVALADGYTAGELLFWRRLVPGERQLIKIKPCEDGESPAAKDQPERRLANSAVGLDFSEENGIAAFTFDGQKIGGENFLQPFITYRRDRKPQRWQPRGYVNETLTGEDWRGCSRARITTQIAMPTLQGECASTFQYTFTLFDDLPYLLVDVAVRFASTPSRDVIANIQQKLRRLIDLRWIETAPFQIHPCLPLSAGKLMRVWKHNHLGVTSYYDLDYGRINPDNKNLDSFNHQVTAGWLAVNGSQNGLLLAESADSLASMAFCPLRLREEQGRQQLWLNPFGSYYGRQLSYRHLGGNGLGAGLTQAISAALKPNGPSFNGKKLDFSLLLAPYHGEQPSPDLQADAAAFFHPPGIIYRQTPAGISAVEAEGMRQWIAAGQLKVLHASGKPLPPPVNFLANPSHGAVDLVWDAPDDPRVNGCAARWRRAGAPEWQTAVYPPAQRIHLEGLENGQCYTFQVCLRANELQSAWTAEQECIPGPVRQASMAGMLAKVSPWIIARVLFYSVKESLRIWLRSL